MAWSKAELMTWIARCEAQRTESLMDVLGVTESSNADALRDAFHGYAKNAHPDLHKLTLTAEDYERLVRAYCRVSLAYATLRDPESKEKYLRELEATAPPPAKKKPTTAPPPAATAARTAVSPKAQIYVRKAEAALRQGDLATAQFNLRLAIASDPTSAALRASLADVEASLRGSKS